jgi:hypothetical protein
MLYVIGMEVLTLMVRKAVDEQLLTGLAGIAPLQRVSIYADDVVLFVKAEEQELLATRYILDVFGRGTGLEINYRKTTATIIRGSEQDRERVRDILHCQLADFPIRYLGLQLALRPLTKQEWQPLLDSVLNVAPAWQRGLIQKQGWLILVKPVISAKHVHQCLVAEAPVWLFEESEK